MSERTRPEHTRSAWSNAAPETSSALGPEAPTRVTAPLPPAPAPRPRRRTRPRTAAALILALVVVAGVAVVSFGARGGGNAVGSPTPASAPVEQKLASPARLTAEPGTLRVLLRWKAPHGDVSLYQVTRDGDLVATLQRGHTRWVDTDVLPTTRYRYIIRALDAYGVPSDPATIVVKTPAAPLALARVQGIYDVRLTTESKFGFSSFPVRVSTGWRLVPVCDAGACDVEWHDTNAHELGGRLHREGATYSGSDSGRFNATCHDTALVSSLTITLHVVRASVVGDAWRATVLEGHVTQRQEAQLGCRPAGADYTARAVRYP